MNDILPSFKHSDEHIEMLTRTHAHDYQFTFFYFPQKFLRILT